MILDGWLKQILKYDHLELLPWVDVGNHEQVNQRVGPHVRVEKLLIGKGQTHLRDLCPLEAVTVVLRDFLTRLVL
jgi:hypothetical protein